MPGAVVGALRVVLGMNAGEFTSQSKKAENSMDRLNARAKKLGVAVGAALGSMAVAAVGVAYQVRQTALDFDKLAKASRAIGVPVEQLTAMRHAAELSGLTVDELTKSFRNLARNMADGAERETKFSRAAAELGVAFKDANGELLRADVFMKNAADRLSQMEDGATKTALLMRLFGEEVGPRLASLVNAGSEGIKAMTDEAEQLGLVISTRAAVAAENFNDNLDRLGKIGTGFSNILAQRMLPALNKVVTDVYAWAKSNNVARNAAEALSKITAGLIVSAYKLGFAWESSALKIARAMHNIKSAATLSFSEIEERNRIVAARISKMWGDLQADIREIQSGFTAGGIGGEAGEGNLGGGAGGDNGGISPTFTPIVKGAKAAGAAMDEAAQKFNQMVQAGVNLAEQLETPHQAMLRQQQELQAALNASKISADQFGQAMQRTTLISSNAYLGMASDIAGSLSKVFGESKAFAIGQAIINTAEGVTKALAAYPPPFNFAAAAAVGAAGAAQIAAIKSASKGGGGSAGGGASVAPAGPTGPQQAVNVTLHGQNFGRDQVFGLIDEINKAGRDGKHVIVTRG